MIMATDSKRISGTKKSKGNVKTTKEHPGEGPSATSRPTQSRAHRDDTPEARAQQRRLPKTHPTRSPSAARKDKGTARR